MDPKLSGLDPKLQDAYNRVMSGPAVPPQPQPAADPSQAGMQTYSDQNQQSYDSMANQAPPPTEPALDNSFGNQPAPSENQSPDQSMGMNQSMPPAGAMPEATPQSFPTDANMQNPQSTAMPEGALPSSPYPSQPTSMPETQNVPPPQNAMPVPPAPLEQGTIPTQPQSNLPPGAIPGITTTVAFNASDSQKNIGTTPVKKGGMHLLPLFIGIGIVLLLAVYTVVWIIIFNVQIPGLPQL